MMPIRQTISEPKQQSLQAIGINDFLKLDVPAREMLLSPILPERSLAMLYAPRGVGKSLVGPVHGIGCCSRRIPSSLVSATATECSVCRWGNAACFIAGTAEGNFGSVWGADIPNDRFRILAADNVEGGINLSTEEGQQAIEPLLTDIDLLILDNLSTLLTSRSESASDAWVPMQNWLLQLRRQGKSVLLIHHAGTNGRQRGTSRREDALDTVIALRRPEDYSPEQGARFEIHFEKLRNRVEGVGAMPFEARLDTLDVDGQQSIRWSCSDLKPPMLMRAAELFGEGLTVREVAATLRISKSEAGRLRIRALEDGLLSDIGSNLNGCLATVQ